VYGSALGSNVIFTNFRRNLAGNVWNIYIYIYLLIVCSVQMNSSIAFFLLDKSNMVNDVPKSNNDDFYRLNPVSSWRCGLWSPHTSVFIASKSLDKVAIFNITLAVALLL
jgi:hypothetical protein